MAKLLFSKELKVSDTDYASEISGLCLSKDGDFLWGVGDKGEIFKIQFDGSYEKIAKYKLDMEGITMDPATGDIYLAVEPKSIYRLAAPDYNNVEHVFDVEEAADLDNKGLEGITIRDGDFILGAQKDATMWHFTMSGQEKKKESLRTVAPTLSEIADLVYDPVKDYLWTVDSKSHSNKVPGMLPFTIYLFNGDATRLLATYDLSAFANTNPEAICIDLYHGCIWVADDCGKKNPSILHKVLFLDL